MDKFIETTGRVVSMLEESGLELSEQRAVINFADQILRGRENKETVKWMHDLDRVRMLFLDGLRENRFSFADELAKLIAEHWPKTKENK
jgi:hypothetical protein